MTKKPLLLSVQPDDDVPLFYAVEWVATHCGTKEPGIDENDVALWEWACGEVLDAIVKGEIDILGVKRRNVFSAADRGSAPPEQLQAYRFRDCAVQSPYHVTDFDVAFDQSGCHWLLRIYPHGDVDAVEPSGIERAPPGAEWYDCGSDSLLNRAMSGWAQLTVKAGAVRRRWPVGYAATNAPRNKGRPTAMEHYMVEHQRRFENDEALPKIGPESRSLEKWGESALDPKDQYTAKPIERAIRKRHPERYAKKII